MQSSPNKPLRYIILDTTIFSYLGNDDLRKQIIPLLQDAVSKDYGISLSKYTIFELINTASVENELKAMGAVKGIKHFPLNETTLIAAGRLGCLYNEDKLNGKKQPEAGDVIIGGTAILVNGLIFTTNGRDFPAPFFKEIARHVLSYKQSDGREVYLPFYFMEPDQKVIEIKYQPRADEIKKLAIRQLWD